MAELFEFPDALQPWLERWRARLAQDALSRVDRQALMYRANPVFIPRNHLVEAAIAAAPTRDDLSVFQQLVDVLGNPHEYRAGAGAVRHTAAAGAGGAADVLRHLSASPAARTHGPGMEGARQPGLQR